MTIITKIINWIRGYDPNDPEFNRMMNMSRNMHNECIERTDRMLKEALDVLKEDQS